MSLCNRDSKFCCVLAAIIVSIIIGILTAFFQITGAITVTTVFLWVTFGIAVVGLGVLLVTAILLERSNRCEVISLNAILAGLLGTILFAVVLLAFGIIATSVVSAILAGLLLLSFTLALTATACFIRCLVSSNE